MVLAPGAADAAIRPSPTSSSRRIHRKRKRSACNSTQTRARRGRIWGMHGVIADGRDVGAVQYETDRARFLAGSYTCRPRSSDIGGRPSQIQPARCSTRFFSLRQRVRLAPEKLLASHSPQASRTRETKPCALPTKYHNPYAFEREAGLAWTKAQVEMRQLQMDADEAHHSNGWRGDCSIRIRRSGRAHTCWRSTPEINRASGPMASAATCRLYL